MEYKKGLRNKPTKLKPKEKKKMCQKHTLEKRQSP